MPPALVAALRLLLTAGIVGAAFAMLVAGGMPDGGTRASDAARATALLLLAAALFAAWWPGERLLLASGALVAALLVEGSGPVAALAGTLATAFGLALAFLHAALPLVALRRTRLPERYRLDAQPWTAIASAASPATRASLDAVRALGFEPVGAGTLAAGTAVTRIVLALHPDDPAIATVSQIDDRGRATDLCEFTQLLADDALLAVSTRALAETLPRPADSLVFPTSATPQAAFATLRELRAGRALRAAPRDGDALARIVERYGDRLLAHWIAAGWVAREPVGGAHRLTVKGAYLATWKLLWPGRRLVAARERRRLEQALAASRATRA